jgi:hypothetical protein
MSKIITIASAALIPMLSLLLVGSPAHAGKNNGAKNSGVILKLDPKKPACETVKTTVCTNNGTGMQCRVVDTGRCKIY